MSQAFCWAWGGAAGLGIGYEFAFSEWTSVAVNFGYGSAFGGEFTSGSVYGVDVMALMTTPGTHRFVLGLGLLANYFPKGDCWESFLLDRDRNCSQNIGVALNLSYRYNPPTSLEFFEIGLATQSGMAVGLKLGAGFTF